MKNGNSAQKKAACIFDIDGDGKFDAKEAKLFNQCQFSLKNDSLTIYDNSGKDKKSLVLKFDDEYGLDNYKYNGSSIKWDEGDDRVDKSGKKKSLLQSHVDNNLRRNSIRNFRSGQITIDKNGSVELSGVNENNNTGIKGRILSRGKKGTVKITKSRLNQLLTRENKVIANDLKGGGIYIKSGKIIASKGADVTLQNSDQIDLDRTNNK